MADMIKRYRSLNDFLYENFGKKIFKLPLSSGLGCPNLDGTLSDRGCVFCSVGSGDFCPEESLSVAEQIVRSKRLLNNKSKNFPDKGFIAYFQSYSNTYGKTEYLEKIFTEAISQPEIEILSVATRPDCLEKEKLDLL
ncbi:MAG: TIGR01212 family radical SAM protein, partial [Clostridia bacterium]|nr:TIGR01212 family radical SAM protein [Clostridia bacterium]